MDSEYDDDELVSSGSPVPAVGARLEKFANADWREGYFDGLATADEMGRGGNGVTFAMGFLSGAVIAGAVAWVLKHFST